MPNLKWFIWRIDKKTRVPFKIKEGDDEEVFKKCLEDCLKNKETNYAIRIEHGGE